MSRWPARVWVLGVDFARKLCCHNTGQTLTLGQVFEQIFEARQARALEIAGEAARRQFFGAEREGVQGLVEDAPAQGHRVLTGLVFEIVTDIAARLGGDRVVEPRGIGARPLGGDHLDGLAALQGLRQRCQATIDAAGDAAVAQFCVYGVGKVHRRSARGSSMMWPLGVNM